MEELMKAGNNFVGYEHREVTVTRGMESLWTDGYANFDWSLEGS